MSGATLSQLNNFDEIIDVRTPTEFSEDHIAGARNFPVLSNEERARVGTIYKQVSTFDAKKLGAALVARNIADHLTHRFADRPKSWRPLVYCWRGGKRSGAMTHILQQIGWRAEQLDGGYKAYRRAVLQALTTLPGQLRYRVICGSTGAGKSELLRALAALGAQVLDLEALAAHRGSILGGLPDCPQPGQKLFESRLWNTLRRFDPAQPVFVEAESKKIGSLRTPDALLDAMWRSECVHLDADREARADYLQREYAHFLQSPETLCVKLDYLTAMHGRERISRWKDWARNGQWSALVLELLDNHYDPAYQKSMRKHYARLDTATRVAIEDMREENLRRAAAQLI